jgi:hypothetical protein
MGQIWQVRGSVSLFINYALYIKMSLLKDYCPIMERKFACPNDLESCGGVSISSW